VTITSEYNGYVPIQFTTAANAVYGFSLAPNEASSSGYPGRVVTYTLQLTNTGNAADIFHLSYASNVWPVYLPVTQTTVSAGTGQAMLVNVLVPTGIVAASDTVTVTATSQGNGAVASARLTTVRDMYKTFLPLIIK